MPARAPGAAWTLLLPPGIDAPAWTGVDAVQIGLPRLPENLRKLWWEQVAVPAAARRLGADVLWVPYWAGPLWQPCPVVVTVHDLIPLLIPAYRRSVLHRAYTSLVSFTARRAAAVITVSKASARDVVEHLGIRRDRVPPIHHGPNAPEGRPQAAASTEDVARVRQKYKLPERYFLYLGGFDARKNVSGILAAYARYLARGGDPAVKLVIGGKLPEVDSDFAPDPQRAAHALGIAEQVIFLGWVDEADKTALYAAAVAFLFPSLYEGFGMPVLEAMAAGAPVVTSGK
jgi:glycosyltransferase involved in cell wall biosynthesis